MIEPCGIAIQFGLKKTGNKQLKELLTHDLSFSITEPKTSVSRRIDTDEYPKMI